MSPSRSVAGVGLLLADDHAQQRRLAGAVGADDADDAAGRQAERAGRRSAAGRRSPCARPRPRRPRRPAAARPGCGSGRSSRWTLRSSAEQLLVALRRALVLPRRALGDRRDPLQLALERPPAGRLGLLLVRQPLLLLLQPGRVVALEGDAAAAVELQDPAGDVVEEVAVVGDGDDRALVVAAGGARARPPTRRRGGWSARRAAAGRAGAAAAGTGRRGGARRRESVVTSASRRRAAQRVHGDLERGVEVPGVDGVDLLLQARRTRPRSSVGVSWSASSLKRSSSVARARPRPPRRCRARPWSRRAAAPARAGRRWRRARAWPRR